jgi:RNA polymerase sigma factor (sigma-70 family)
LVASEQESGARLDLGATYDAHRNLLIGTAIARYGIAEADAEPLLHDVFVAYLIHGHDVRDTRAWLVSAICNASKAYLRTRARVVGLPEAFADEPDPASVGVGDRLPDALAARECFACLTARCQLALRLRYLEGYSVPEIAAELQTSAKYAQKLVSRCLQQAHDRYAKGAL